MKDCTNFAEKPFQPRKQQDRPKRVAMVEEDKQELEELAKEMEEVIIGEVSIEDF